MESNPSVAAVLSSFEVTSMHRQANCLPDALEASGGRTTGSPAEAASALSSSTTARSISCPRAAAVSSPASLPCATAASGVRVPATAPTAWACSGISTGRNACIVSSNASRAPACANRFVEGTWTQAITTRSQATFCPDVEPGGPTVTPVTCLRPCAATIVEPGTTGKPSGHPPSDRRSTTVTAAPASRNAQAVAYAEFSAARTTARRPGRTP